MDWKDITVGQFLDLYKLGSEPIEEMEKVERAVGIIYDLTPTQVEQLKVSEFNAKAKEAAKFLTSEIPGKRVRTIKVGKKRYRITYDPTKLRHRQYVEIIHFGEKPVDNMHLIMASLVQPKKSFRGRGGSAIKFMFTGKSFEPYYDNQANDHGKIAEDMLNARVTDVYHACVFFCNLYKGLMQSTQDFLETEMMRTGRTRKEANELITASINAMDGFFQPQKLQSTKESA